MAVVDEHGLLVRLMPTPGQTSDKAAARMLIEDLPLAEAFVGDRGSDWKYPVDLVNSKGGDAELRTQRHVKKQRSVDRHLYRRRNLIERFFNRLKHFRRIATRFGKLARNFFVAVMLASTRLWLKACDSTT